MKNQRKKVWIDYFQTCLFARIACYFIFYQLAVWAFVFIARSNAQALELLLGQDVTGFLFVTAFATVLFIGLLFTLDSVKYVHRFVGPIVRFRQVVRAVAAGDEVALVKLRKDDFLKEFQDEFNEMLKALEHRGAVTLKDASHNQPAAV